MKTDKAIAVQAFDAPNKKAFDWDMSAEALEKFRPVHAKSEDERTLTIASEIGETWDGTGVTTSYVRGFLRRVGSGPISININSPGGDYFTGLAIYNLLREHEGEVNTNVLGVAASAASLIAMASDNLRVAKAGFLMIHNAWGVAIGNQFDMAETSNILAKFDKVMAEVYAGRSGISLADIEAAMKITTFYSGTEAVENGLADGLLASDEIEVEKGDDSASALRQLDVFLARASVPRKERRALLKAAFDGTPGAAENVMPGADADQYGEIAAFFSNAAQQLRT